MDREAKLSWSSISPTLVFVAGSRFPVTQSRRTIYWCGSKHASPRLGQRFLNWSIVEQETQGLESNCWICFRLGLCAGAMKRRITTGDTLSGDGDNEEGVEPMENRQGRGFPQAPHPLSFLMRKEQTTRNDQLNETVH